MTPNPHKFKQITDNCVEREELIDRVFANWWDLWMKEVFDSLFPYKRWKDLHPNLQIGDICMLVHDAKLGRCGTRICRVVDVHPDPKGVVRTVTIESRPRDSREKSLPYNHKDLVTQKVSIQRLILILPYSQQHVASDMKATDVQLNHVIAWPVLSLVEGETFIDCRSNL